MGGHGYSLPSPVTYGYSSFTPNKIFKWIPLESLEKLEPNSYCALRTHKRVMTEGSTLNYTMSPLVIPNELLPPQSLKYNVQFQHQNLLETMKNMLVMKLNPNEPTDEIIKKKRKLKIGV